VRLGNHRRRGAARRFPRALLGLLLICQPGALALLVILALRHVDLDRLLRVRSWEAVGVRHCAKKRIRDALDELVGTGMRRVDVDTVCDFLAQDPWIAQASLLRCWPGSLRLVVEERRPLAFLVDGPSLRCLTNEGRLLVPPAANRPLDLPVLRKVVSPPGMSRAAVLAEAARALLEVRTTHPEIFAEIDCLAWGPVPELRLRGGGSTILLSREGWRHSCSLLEVVRRMRPELIRQRAELDLRFTNKIVLRGSDA